MVWFTFYDDKELIPTIAASDDFPDEVASIDIEGPFDDDMDNYTYLVTMLNNLPKKLKSITVDTLTSAAESPAFLALVVLICNKTNSLHLSRCRISTNAMSCLMSNLLPHDGIRCLEFSWEYSVMPTNEAMILLEGVAASPCLESFKFNIPGLVSSQDVSLHLIQALCRNKSLKNFSIDTGAFSEKEFQYIVKGAISQPNLKTVSIVDTVVDRELLLDALQGALCRKDCAVEKLSFEGFGISIAGRHNRWSGSCIQNVSVTSFTIFQGALSHGDTLSDMIGLFKSLVHLDLYGSGITDLSFLESILFGESSQLKRLRIAYNDIGEEEMRLFIDNLRKIRGSKLKHLEICQNGWGDDTSASLETALVDALRPNTDLEYVDFDQGDLPLHLNRGGRRVFDEPSSEPFPTNLLPHVLERASKISYYEYDHNMRDEWGSTNNTEARADVVFWMMQRIVPRL